MGSVGPSESVTEDLVYGLAVSTGGPVDMQESAASNYPLRGGKYSTYEVLYCGSRSGKTEKQKTRGRE